MLTLQYAVVLVVLPSAAASMPAASAGSNAGSGKQNLTQESCLLQQQRRVEHSASQGDRRPMMSIKRAVFENRCPRPVYLYGTQGGVNTVLEIPTNVVEEFNESRGFVPWREQRITLSFARQFDGKFRPTNLDASVIELNADYYGFTVPKSHLSFITQLGFSDLNLEVALWKDHVNGQLAVEGGNAACFSRAKTAFKVSECSFGDDSGRVLHRSWGDLCMPVCPSTGLASGAPCDTSCFVEAGTPVEYAKYCSHQSQVYKGRRWRRSPPTVDVHLRQCAQQWSPTFECWDNQAGPIGFPICDGPDAKELPDELGVWQVVACPDSPSRTCTTSDVSEACRRNLDWAMQDGIHQFPERFPGLVPASSRDDFQWNVHERLGRCPEPCTRNRNIAPVPTCDRPSTKCLDDVRWAMRYGIHEHPEWYAGLTPASPMEDFQRHIYRVLGTCPDPLGPGPGCGRELSAACRRDLDWAMVVGIREHPEWYPGLAPDSPMEAFQRVVHENLGTCPMPCEEPAAAA
mmetsp:Transcript_119268/g.349042  ORF Transcript_119268/g.349042 Transcript_119268/m.349042 type:complete len:516 (+) Transcript_119268:53-1600(+)